MFCRVVKGLVLYAIGAVVRLPIVSVNVLPLVVWLSITSCCTSVTGAETAGPAPLNWNPIELGGVVVLGVTVCTALPAPSRSVLIVASPVVTLIGGRFALASEPPNRIRKLLLFAGST